MKRLLLLGVLLAIPAAHAQGQKVKCPGENTMEMRYCAGQSWQQSTDQLKRKIPKALFQQWKVANQRVCTRAYALYKEGSIYQQLVVGCEDRLNRALLKEFRPMGN